MTAVVVSVALLVVSVVLVACRASGLDSVDREDLS